MGAVSSTLIAGVEAVKRGLALPVGAYSQLGKIQLNNDEPLPVKEVLPLVSLDHMVFGGWDIFPGNCHEIALANKVIEPAMLEEIREPLSAIEVMPGVFDRDFVPRLEPVIKKQAKSKMEYAELLRKDIRDFMSRHSCDRGIMLWCASTETFNPLTDMHMDLKTFEKGLKNNDPAISPTQIYAYAALSENIPFINGSPNLSSEVPALQQLAENNLVPIAGSDFKTGQTLLKTIIAPGLRKRLLGVSGWYSTNILGNRDGEVLDEPKTFRSKEITKTNVLNTIFSASDYPELYEHMHHIVKINYYPPRGDNKESWDNIDIFGWMGYPMQIKINFLARDSILAAPVALDLILFTDLAMQAGYSGIQSWLGYFFKSPCIRKGEPIIHDLNIQFDNFESTLKAIINTKTIVEKKLVND